MWFLRSQKQVRLKHQYIGSFFKSLSTPTSLAWDWQESLETSTVVLVTLLTFRRITSLIPTPVPEEAHTWKITWACWFNSLLELRLANTMGICESYLTCTSHGMNNVNLTDCDGWARGSYCFPEHCCTHTRPSTSVLCTPAHDFSEASASILLTSLSPVLKYRLLEGRRWILLFHFARWNIVL